MVLNTPTFSYYIKREKEKVNIIYIIIIFYIFSSNLELFLNINNTLFDFSTLLFFILPRFIIKTNLMKHYHNLIYLA